MKAFGISNQGLVRSNNEDAFYIDLNKNFLIVADGMGGHAGGEEASQLAVKTVVDSLGQELYRQPELNIKNAIMSANRAVLTRSASESALAGMGTTLTMVALLPDFLFTGHIGDSRAYIIDSDDIRCLTGDHSVSGQLLASGKITTAEAAKHVQRHVLTRALGTGASIDIEVLRHPWSPGQHVLLCSDGLTEVVSASDISEVVHGYGSLEQKVHRLLNIVLERGAPDNVTIILAQL